MPKCVNNEFNLRYTKLQRGCKIQRFKNGEHCTVKGVTLCHWFMGVKLVRCSRKTFSSTSDRFSSIQLHVSSFLLKRNGIWGLDMKTSSINTNFIFLRFGYELGSITSRCSGKEPALLSRRFFSGSDADQTRESGGNRA